MSGIVQAASDLVSSVGSAVVDTVSSVGSAVVSVADFAVNQIVAPVVQTVGNVISSVAQNPVKAIAQIAAVASGNAWALPLIEGADVAASGGNIGDVLKAAAISYVAGKAGQFVGNAAGSAASSAFDSQVAGKIIGQGAASATVAAVTGGNPLQAFVTGGVSAGVSAAVGNIPGFADFQKANPIAAGAIAGGITASLTGGNVTAAAINGAIAGGQYVSKAVAGLNLDDQAKSVIADVMMSTVSAGVAGGDMSKAMQNAFLRAGNKALGDMATDKFQQVVTEVKNNYNAADQTAQALDQNGRDQVRVVDQYNAVKDEWNNAVATQQTLYDQYAAAKAAFEAAPSTATADALNAKVLAYNNYSTQMQGYTATWQGQLDTYTSQLTLLQKDQALMNQSYEQMIQAFTNSSDQLAVQMQDVQRVTNKNLALAYDPNFNADEYARINNLDPAVDPYAHYVETGQKQQLFTNDKDVAMQAEVAAYKAAMGQDIPPETLANLGARSDRVTAVKNFTDVAVADKQVVDNNRKLAFEAVYDSYVAQGLTQEQITKKIDSGEATAFANQITANQRASVDYLQQEARNALNQYGQDSKQYKDAANAALSAQVAVGGYGVTRNSSGTYVTATAGEIDPNTMVPVSSGGYDPITGRVLIVIDPKEYDPVTGKYIGPQTYSRWGDLRIGNTTLGAIGNGDVNSVFSSGQSAKPPDKGGTSVFGDGSGVSSGLFGGLQIIARDSGTGATMYDGGNGYSLITYSDGHSVAVKNDTQEVVWLDNTQTQTLQKQIEQAHPTPTIPAPTKPIVDPVQDAITEVQQKIDQNILSAEEIKKMFANTGYTPSDTQIASMVTDAGAQKAASSPDGTTTPTGASTTTDIYGNSTAWTPVTFDVTSGTVTGTTSQPTSSTTAPATGGTTTAPGGTTTPGGTSTDLTQQIMDQAAKNEAAGLSRDVALAGAINSVAGNLNTTRADLLTKIGATEADLTNKLNTAVTNITVTQQAIIDQAAKNEAAGMQRDVALSSAISTVAGNLNTTRADLLTKIGATEATLNNKLDSAVTTLSNAQQAIIDQAAKNEAAGMQRDVALATAISTVAGNLNTTKADLLAKIGTTEATLTDKMNAGLAGVRADLANAEKAILDQTAKNEAAGMARDVALAGAIGTVSEQLGETKTDLLTKIGTTEANLNSKLDTAKAELTGQITGVQKDLTGQITGVKNTVGSATQAGTQSDIDHLLGVLQNGGAYDKAYDFNGDGKLDGSDLTGLTSYVNGNGTGTTAGGTGTGATGTGTGASTGTAPSGGSKWGTPTGVFKTIADTATNTQRMGNINTMMSLLAQSPDAGGQQVTVKAADPTKIGYVYDFNSIFANPTQQNMFVTPYAEGGSVGSIDEVNDELLKILKG